MVLDFRISLAAASLAMALGAWQPLARAVDFERSFVFGDSLSDRGNFLTLTGGAFPGAPFFFPGRFSNGDNWTDYLSEELGLSGSATVNYALGGATTGSGNIAGPSPPFYGLQQQIDTFLQGLDPSGQPLVVPENSLFTLWAGANDYLQLEGRYNKTREQKELVAGTIANLSAALRALADFGPRAIVVPNLPDLRLTPLVAGTDRKNQNDLLDIVGIHNKELEKELKKLGKDFPETKFILFDSENFFRKLSARPEKFGLIDGTRACTNTDLYIPGSFPPATLYAGDCNPSVENQYLWWDSVHPTTYVHGLLAKEVIELLEPKKPKNNPAPLDTTLPGARDPASVPEPSSPWAALFAVLAGSLSLRSLKGTAGEREG